MKPAAWCHSGDACRWRHNARKKAVTLLAVKPKHSGVDVRAEGATVRAEAVVMLETQDKYEEVRDRAVRLEERQQLSLPMNL